MNGAADPSWIVALIVAVARYPSHRPDGAKSQQLAAGSEGRNRINCLGFIFYLPVFLSIISGASGIVTLLVVVNIPR